jgi:2',3'-cyclic-nucleotide 2'-phosphodiesterase (5'-nucleotidase family)
VGFIGILTPSTQTSNAAGKNMTMLDIEGSYDRCVASLRDAHPDVDMVISLSHIGMDMDKDMAPKLKGKVDMVLGAHSHDFHSSPVGEYAPQWFKSAVFDDSTNTWIPVTRANCGDDSVNACAAPLANTPYPYYNPAGGPPVMQAGFGSMYAHGLRLNFRVQKKRPRRGYPRGVIQYSGFDILTAGGQAPALMGGANSTNPITPDPAVQAFIASIVAPVQDFKTKKIGFAFNDVPKYQPGPRRKWIESPLSDYVCDGQRATTIKNINAVRPPNPAVRVTLGITQLGGIRADITQGDLTYADALRVLPFGNLLWVKDFPAKVLLEAYQHGVVSQKWLKTSGPVRVYQTWSAGNVVTLKSLWVLFDGDVNYTEITAASEDIIRIATTDYLIQGGNGYTMLANNGVDVLDGPGDPVADVFAEQLQLDYEANGGTTFQIDVNNPRIIQCELVTCGGAVAPLYAPCCV